MDTFLRKVLVLDPLAWLTAVEILQDSWFHHSAAQLPICIDIFPAHEPENIDVSHLPDGHKGLGGS